MPMDEKEQAEFDKMKKRAEAAEKRAETAESAFEAASKASAENERNYTMKLALHGAGITDPDDQDTVLTRYNKLPEEDRPDLAKWLGGDAKKDRIAGMVLSNARGKGAADDNKGAKSETKGAEKGTEKPPEKAGKSGASVRETPDEPTDSPSSTGGFTDAQIRAMSDDDLKKHMPAIRKGWADEKATR